GRDESGSRHYRGTVGAVARRRREQIPTAVGDTDIGGIGLRGGVAEARAESVTRSVEIAGRRHLGRGAGGGDEPSAPSGVFRGNQGRERHLDHRRVAEISLSVGKSEL